MFAFFPVRDKNPSRVLPWVVYLLVAGNIFAFVYQLSLPPQALEVFVTRFGLVPARYTDPLAVLLNPVPWVSSMFLHGGLGHIAGNLLYLYIFGDNVEDALGHSRFVRFYLICGLAAALTQYVMYPHSMVPMIGASGAISGVLGAYTVLFPAARVTTFWWLLIWIRFIDVPAFLYLGLWFLGQLLSGVGESASAAAVGGGVAFWAHIGGFIAGVVLVKFFQPTRRR